MWSRGGSQRRKARGSFVMLEKCCVVSTAGEKREDTYPEKS